MWANCLISLWPRSSFLSTFFQVFGGDLFSLSALFKDLLYAGSPPAVVLQSPLSLSLSLSAHTSPELASFTFSFSPPIPPRPVSHIPLSYALFSLHYPCSEVKIPYSATCAASQRCVSGSKVEEVHTVLGP